MPNSNASQLANYHTAFRPVSEEHKGANRKIYLYTEKYHPFHSVSLVIQGEELDEVVDGIYTPSVPLKEGEPPPPWPRWRFDLGVGFPAELKVHFLLDKQRKSQQVQATSAVFHFFCVDAGGEIAFEGQDPPDNLPKLDYPGLQVEPTRLSQMRLGAPRGQVGKPDVIVIGAGLTGGVLANRLSNSGLQTLVLEAGGVTFPTHVNNILQAVDFRDHRGLSCRLAAGSNLIDGAYYAVGGRSVFWSGLVPRLLDWELDLPHWPSSIPAGLRKYYPQAEEVVRRAATLGPWAQRVASDLTTRLRNYRVQEMPWAMDTRSNWSESLTSPATGIFNTADLLLNSADPNDAGHGFLQVNVGQLATELLHDGSRITGVRCYDLYARKERTFTANHYVLAMGVIGTPRLALASGLRDASGKMGVGLTDHPKYWLWDGSTPVGQCPFVDPDKHAKLRVVPNEPYLPIYGELNLNTLYWHRRWIDGTPPPPRREEVQLSFDAYGCRTLDDNNRVAADGLFRRAKVSFHSDGWGNMGRRVTELQEVLTEMRGEVLETLGLPVPNGKPGPFPEGTIQHAVGTMRMGTSGQAVVDSNQRHWAYDNLFVTDNSVFPYAPTPNPGLTAIALTLRLGDHLRALI